MRPIQPTLLLLLVAIHCESCPVSHDEEDEKEKKELKKCLADKCQREEYACKIEPECMTNFDCMEKYCSLDKNRNSTDLVKCYNECDPIQNAVELRQCANKNCFPMTDFTCPGEGTKGIEVPVNWPNLVEQLKGETWHAVAIGASNKKGPFDQPCFEVRISGDRNKTVFDFSNCIGDSTRGQCLTGFTKFHGEGKQRGDLGIIDLKINEEAHLLDPTHLTAYFRKLVEGKYAVVFFCMKNFKYGILSKEMVISTFPTLTSLRNNLTKAEHQQLLRDLGLIKSQRILPMHCRN